MSVSTTVKTLYPAATDDQINIYLPLLAEADACLSAYSQDLQDLTKALAIAHLIEQSNGGRIMSEKTRTGASASYAELSGVGLSSSQYGVQLLGLPTAKCITSVLGGGARFGKVLKPRYGCR